jgi:chorismate synthase
MLKPKDVTNALKDTEAILTNFESLKIKVEEEVYAKVKMRSDKKVSPFAKKSSFKAI